MVAVPTSPAGFPMAPSVEEWEALSPARFAPDLIAVLDADDVPRNKWVVSAEGKNTTGWTTHAGSAHGLRRMPRAPHRVRAASAAFARRSRIRGGLALASVRCMSADTAVLPQPTRDTDVARRPKPIVLSTPTAGMLWFAGWLFTIAFAQLGFWKALLALVIWPYFLGVLAR